MLRKQKARTPKKENKEGLGPSQVAQAWPLNHPKNKPKNNKQKPKNPKKRENNKKKRKTRSNTNYLPTTKEKQSKQNRNKSNTKKEKQTQETEKHLNLPNPKINKKKPSQKSPKTVKNTSIFNTCGTMADTQKQTTITMKPQKKQTQKTPFCHVQKQPNMFHKFSVFIHHTVLVFDKLCFLRTL